MSTDDNVPDHQDMQATPAAMISTDDNFSDHKDKQATPAAMMSTDDPLSDRKDEQVAPVATEDHRLHSPPRLTSTMQRARKAGISPRQARANQYKIALEKVMTLGAGVASPRPDGFGEKLTQTITLRRVIPAGWPLTTNPVVSVPADDLVPKDGSSEK